MRPQILISLLMTAAVALAGCSGSADDGTEPPVDDTPAKPPAKKDPAPEPEPEPFTPVQVYNDTLSFDVQAVAGDAFEVPEGAAGLGGRIEVHSRELCSTLQANSDQEGPSVVLTAPGGAKHAFKLDPRAAVCATDGSPLQTVLIDLESEPGQWSIGLKGVGNVDADVEIWAMP